MDKDDCRPCYGTGDRYIPLEPDGGRLVRVKCSVCQGSGERNPNLAQTLGREER